MKGHKLWHQRLGHCLTRAMIETRKCSEGIPSLPTNNPFFKYMKRTGNKLKDEDVVIPGQAYYMDLAIVSRPSNLEDLLTSTNKPKLTV